jgi:hypothetical protein
LIVIFSNVYQLFTTLRYCRSRAILADATLTDIPPPKEGPQQLNFTTASEVVFLYDAPLLYETRRTVSQFDADRNTIIPPHYALEDASVDRELQYCPE